MRRNSALSDTNSDSSMSSAFSAYSADDLTEDRTPTSNSKQFFTNLVQKTRSQVEQKTSEINATMQEKLPEWKQRGAMYSSKAKETGIEWSRRGKEAVDRWKKDRAEENAHNSNSRQSSSSSSISQSENAVFGMPLEVAVALTKIDADDLIPAVFKRCIEYLDHVGIHEVGLYRIPGSTITVNKLRAVFNDGSDIDFDTTQPDPHAVGTLLKMYLRELPEPIIPLELNHEYSQQFMQSIKSSNEGDRKAMEDTINVTTSLSTVETSKLPPISPELLNTVKSITSRLPIYNFCLLQLLCKHLKNVADHESENRMSISNLAVIFIPTLNIGRALFHCMVEHYQDLFEGIKKTKAPPPPLPQKPRNLSISSADHAITPPSLPPTNSPRRIFHAKTMSDTDLMKRPMTATTATATSSHSSSSTNSNRTTNCNNTPPSSIKIPPPKPSRSPAAHSQQQQHLPPRPPQAPPVKPRSKSVSSPHRVVQQQQQQQQHQQQQQLVQKQQANSEEAFWKQSGRVEAIGKQFETLMNSNITMSSPTSFSASSSSLRK
ncbi:CTD phosphatase Fcp1 [Mucor velutinosus]|uniref:CTD phosphatase Fcp1 n=1 Tax=Mucor velutinosus TaxID=708070 RepID=A0AAN7DNG0_9FUNG|nr:CTD phosphatase Fcp1 [Mucor velutinosus]